MKSVVGQLLSSVKDSVVCIQGGTLETSVHSAATVAPVTFPLGLPLTKRQNQAKGLFPAAVGYLAHTLQ